MDRGRFLFFGFVNSISDTLPYLHFASVCYQTDRRYYKRQKRLLSVTDSYVVE